MAGEGHVLGRYVLCGEIASGGMATVHLARHLGPHGFCRSVAVKRLHDGLAKDPDFVAMFLDEARLASRIHHPNVASIIDVISTPTELCLVMDYLHGENLGELVRRSLARDSLPAPAVASAIVIDALRGLHAAHEVTDLEGRALGLIHRDVSPQNLFVGTDGVARVLDFGIAKASSRSQVTRDGQVKGKLAYMAPEQVRSEPADRRVDVFAAGVVLWELLTGKRLFGNKEPGAAIHDILFRERPAPSTVRDGIPEELDQVVLRALSVPAKERFADAEHMAEALRAACPPSPPAGVSAWVKSLAASALSTRAAQLRAAERLGTDELEEFTRASADTDENSLQDAIRRVLARDDLADDATQADELAEAIDDPTTVAAASTLGEAKAPSDDEAAPSRTPVGLWVAAGALGTAALFGVGLLAFSGGRAAQVETGLVPLALPVPSAMAPAAPPEVASAKPAASVAEPAPSATAPAPPPKVVPRPRCSPPYYFDNGIKRYKPGCL